MSTPGWAAAAATLPLVALALLVFATRRTLATAAWLTAAGTAALALLAYRLPADALLLAAGKGAWTGLWIVALIAPALALFETAHASGALRRLGDALATVAPTRARQLLLLAWILPGFLQGVAGFGVPVVIAAPMLVQVGLSPVSAVALCLVGYHWSVTFGSMGSSFFIAAGTAQLGAAATTAFAAKAAGLLAVNALVAAGLVLRRAGSGAWEAVPRALVLALVMGATLVAVALVQPALGSTAAGLAGLLAAAVVLPGRARRPQWRPLLRAAAPFVVLVGLIGLVFGVAPLRALAELVPAAAPDFPATTTALGHENPPVIDLQPLHPLLHPGPWLAVSALAAWGWYRRTGWLERTQAGPVVSGWLRRLRGTGSSVLGLTVLAAVMVDAGMIALLADALTGALGGAYDVAVPVVGAAGTVLTGSTSAANALLSPLQVEAAARLGVDATTLLAAQTAGGNVGNALTPLTIAVAATAVGCAGQEGAVLRRVAPDAAVLLAVLAAGTLLLGALT